MKVAVISIGNEILLGKTTNTNLTYIGEKLAKIGLDLDVNKTIKDNVEDISSTLLYFWENYDIVITTGGLGPTNDDITKQVIADFFDKKLNFIDEIWENIKTRFEKRGIKIPEINKNQALVPNDFQYLINDFGTAPGLFYQNNNKLFFALPGVPTEMKHLLDDKIIPILQSKFNFEPYFIRTIHTYNIAESALAEILQPIQIPSEIKLAYLPQTGRVDLRFSGQNQTLIESTINKISPNIKKYIFGFDEENVSKLFHNTMLQNKLTISVAESCTGGLVQKMITDNSGSSKYFLGGIVTYDNKIKEKVLHVEAEVLNKFGAVSSQVALQMVENVQKLFSSDIAISITGIAGPTGGTEEKPVGTVFVGYYFKGKTEIKKYYFSGDRETIRLKVAEKVMMEIIYKIKEEIK